MPLIPLINRLRVFITLTLASVALGLAGWSGPAHAQTNDAAQDKLSELRWRFIGPNGNRVAAVAGALPG